ncbi:MAG: alpha-hydroxy-acid oxidizing protein [Lachnospiraceae bacterium]|nr:alpha-hydroxy-acid oxidizing protein [Lachnospiraceae bacterium]
MAEEMRRRSGNSNQITRDYLDSLLIETRYMNAKVPTTECKIFGRKASSPIMTAALSHLDKHLYEGALTDLAAGAKAAGAIMWMGMEGEEAVEACLDTGADCVEIIKPYADRAVLFSKIHHAKKRGVAAIGIDIDHPFAKDGTPDVVDGLVMKPLKTKELAEIKKIAGLPVIIKGVLSVRDAKEAVKGGADAIVLSHHNNRIEYAIPPLMALPEIARAVKGKVKIIVDCEIATGMDAFKALALGADAVCIGRPLMKALAENKADGVRDYLVKATEELRYAMACTGCVDLTQMDPDVIKERRF